MSGKGCWLVVAAIFLVATGLVLWIRAEEYRVIRLCIDVGGTWDYQATQCRF